MSYSDLVSYIKLSPNCTKPRTSNINAIVIHHMAGNLTVEGCGDIFAKASRQASSNYGIGTDGRIACYVEEANRSWCSSNREIDHRAITIEVANDGGDPDWHISDKALESLINLCTDICKRHGFKPTYTGDKTGSLHMHKWYAATACPGPYLGGKFPYIAEEVSRRLKSDDVSKPTKPTEAAGAETILYRVQVGAFAKRANAEAQLDKVKAAGFSDAFIAVVDGRLYRVQVGAFQSKANAAAHLAKIKAAGFKGFVTQLSGIPMSSKSVDEVAREVIQGKWGTGAERKRRLTEAGHDFSAVQARVNELMS